MKKELKLLSPAKINLRLDVLGKREDGYHEIESIMTRVSLYDEIMLSVDGGDSLEVVCSGSAPSGESNIAYKAAKAIMNIFQKPVKVKIEINKTIPVAAGLGGGSSNAGSVLIGLNKMLDTGLSKEELMKIGALLGADVPFFIHERPAIARGIGERLEAVELPRMWFVLVNPNIPVSTAEVYKGLNLKIGLTKKRFDINMSNLNTREVLRLLHNDLEPVALGMQPQIAIVKNTIASSGAAGVLMSGSGATVFGLFEGKTEATTAFKFLSENYKGWRVFLTENI